MPLPNFGMGTTMFGSAQILPPFRQANLYFCDGGAEDFAAMEEADEPELPLTTHILRNEHVQTHTIPSMWSVVQKRDAYRMAYARHWNSTASSTGPHGELEGVVD